MAIIDKFLNAMAAGIIEQAERIEALGKETDESLALRDYFSQMVAVAEEVNARTDKVADWMLLVDRIGIDVCECEPYNDLPGVRFPVEVDGDTTRPWIERCDQCARYPGDWDAARALVAAGVIPGFSTARLPGTRTSYPYALRKERP